MIMSSGDLDRIPVNQLSDRYNLVRSAVYTRMEALGIRPQRIGNKAFIVAEQLALLDELHEFLQTGRTTAEFLDMKGLSESDSRATDLSAGQSSGLTKISPDIFNLVRVIAGEFANRLQPPAPEPDRFAYYETLERAYRNGWLLSTSEVAYLLDLAPSAIRATEDSFTEAGFVFTKAGYRAQGDIAWRVSKP